MDRNIILIIASPNSLTPSKEYTHHSGLRILVSNESIQVFHTGILSASFHGRTAMSDAKSFMGYKLGKW